MEACNICYVLHNSVQFSVLCFTTPFTTAQFTQLSVGNIVLVVCEPCSVGEKWVMAKTMG